MNFDPPNDHPTDHPTCKIALFEPLFFVAIQELAGIFLAVQTSQNAHLLNAIKQPFEHPLTAVYTPLSLPIIFVVSGKCPCASLPAVLPTILPPFSCFLPVFPRSFNAHTSVLPLFSPRRRLSFLFLHTYPPPNISHLVRPYFPLPRSCASVWTQKKSDRRSAISAPSSRHYFDFRPSEIKPNSTPSRSILTLH